eukprot:TRINITY_DN1011_c0_g1_i1.p1 TRINITY_DN1011_c0_g1~~TRINITY_DN1011_c0_g1_i1.p1  ORF type:complete len:346 (-),score=-3.50 TRINITY_DN1011_c0_g1_i1:332-1369(-)
MARRPHDHGLAPLFSFYLTCILLLSLSPASTAAHPRRKLYNELYQTNSTRMRISPRHLPSKANSVNSSSTSGALPTGTLSIRYNGGRLMVNPMAVHVIYLGTWSTGQKTIIEDFLRSFTVTTSYYGVANVYQWWRIARLYKDGRGRPVTPNVYLGSRYHAPGTSRMTLSDSRAQSLLKYYISRRILPKDSNAHYLFLSGLDVSVPDFCSIWCGYHYNVNNAYTYSVIGMPPTSCLSGCAPLFASTASGGYGYASPNGDKSVDGMIDTIAHELAEMAEDPYQTGWYDTTSNKLNSGDESCDYCAGLYDPLFYYNSQTKSVFNVFGYQGKGFLIQQNYNFKMCVMSA